jgi:hypothetical protein
MLLAKEKRRDQGKAPEAKQQGNTQQVGLQYAY